MSTTAYYWDPMNLEHDTGPHVECIARAERLQPERMKKRVASLNSYPIEHHSAADWVLRVHKAEHHELVRTAFEHGFRSLDESDTIISEMSYESALVAVDAALSAADAVLSRKADNAFCAMRPPGHHALPFMSMGFCLFATPAILTRYLQEQHGLKRIAIVDWDVHHGNGTNDIFLEDENVLFVSLHQSPLFPGTGSWEDVGEGPGVGLTLNLPVQPGTEQATYLSLFDKEVLPIVRNHKPEFLIISAGFDAHRDDPLADLLLTEEGFSHMTRELKNIAEEYCEGQIISLLEGGYNLDALENSVVAHLLALSE